MSPCSRQASPRLENELSQSMVLALELHPLAPWQGTLVRTELTHTRAAVGSAQVADEPWHLSPGFGLHATKPSDASTRAHKSHRDRCNMRHLRKGTTASRI